MAVAALLFALRHPARLPTRLATAIANARTYANARAKGTRASVARAYLLLAVPVGKEGIQRQAFLWSEVPSTT